MKGKMKFQGEGGRGRRRESAEVTRDQEDSGDRVALKPSRSPRPCSS